MDPEKIREELRKLVADMNGIKDVCIAEKREMTPEEETRFDKLAEEFDKKKAELEKCEEKSKKTEERQRRLDEANEYGNQSQGRMSDNPPAAGGAPSSRGQNPRDTAEYREAFNRFLRSGMDSLNEREIRAMQADNDAGGGFLVTPQEFVNDLLKGLDNDVVVRGLARTIPLVRAESLGVPTLETDVEDAEWTPELKVGGMTELTFGKRELRPHPVSKCAKISNKLLRVAAQSIELLVRERLQYKFAVTQEKAFLLGDGVQKPLGLFVASPDGIPTSRDVNAGSSTGPTGDGLIDSRYAIKEGYIRNAHWLWHRDSVKAIRKLKNVVDGQYIWQPGITGGVPDRILEVPYILSDYCPNTLTSGNYIGLLGDFSYYWIVDALDMQIQRLVELFALTNQTGFIGRMETDGMPTLAEAFVRIKCN